MNPTVAGTGSNRALTAHERRVEYLHDDTAIPGPQARRGPLLATGAGTNLGAFGPIDWSLLTLIAMIWGSSFALIDVALESFAPALVAWLRIALGAGALALVPRARRTRIERDDLPRTMLIGVLWMGIPLLLFPLAQQWIDSSVAGMLNGAMPLMTAAWAALLLRRLPGRRQVLGLTVGFIGIVAIFVPESPRFGGTGSAEAAMGTALVVVAIALYGLSANLAVPLQQRYGGLALLLRAQLTALVVITPFGLFAWRDSSFSWASAIAVVPLGVLGTGAAFVLMATLVGRVGGPRGAIAVYFVPIVAIVLGVVWRGDELAGLALVGSALVLVGAFVASRAERDDDAR